MLLLRCLIIPTMQMQVQTAIDCRTGFPKDWVSDCQRFVFMSVFAAMFFVLRHIFAMMNPTLKGCSTSYEN